MDARAALIGRSGWKMAHACTQMGACRRINHIESKKLRNWAVSMASALVADKGAFGIHGEERSGFVDDKAQPLTLADVAHNEIGLWLDEPLRFQETDIDNLLLWCVKRRATDVSLQTDRPIYIEVDGTLYPVIRRSLDFRPHGEYSGAHLRPRRVGQACFRARSRLSYEIRPERNTRYRFRTNITAIFSRGRDFGAGHLALPAEFAADDGRSWHRRRHCQ